MTLKSNDDLWVLDPDVSKLGFDQTTFLTLTDKKRNNIQIRFDWCNYSTSKDGFAYLLISETNKLFFGARFFWGVIDLPKLEVYRQESCAQFWSLTRKSESIVVISELEALALSLDGITYDKVPIDPPFDSEGFEDRIEFDSPVFGRQTLKLKK